MDLIKGLNTPGRMKEIRNFSSFSSFDSEYILSNKTRDTFTNHLNAIDIDQNLYTDFIQFILKYCVKLSKLSIQVETVSSTRKEKPDEEITGEFPNITRLNFRRLSVKNIASTAKLINACPSLSHLQIGIYQGSTDGKNLNFLLKHVRCLHYIYELILDHLLDNQVKEILIHIQVFQQLRVLSLEFCITPRNIIDLENCLRVLPFIKDLTL